MRYGIIRYGRCTAVLYTTRIRYEKGVTIRQKCIINDRWFSVAFRVRACRVHAVLYDPLQKYYIWSVRGVACTNINIKIWKYQNMNIVQDACGHGEAIKWASLSSLCSPTQRAHVSCETQSLSQSQLHVLQNSAPHGQCVLSFLLCGV